ncbi:hypothetical protein ElyMa_006646100 [Elysia marginata]|uniref:Uncharacterized protein n=1 Tax=Elysia marginata TaxID=1093978 RepID=A0AAV4IEN7_9GAST|nr:hypothetical protein ElyMa_006646100 [Elysia marginata]
MSVQYYNTLSFVVVSLDDVDGYDDQDGESTRVECLLGRLSKHGDDSNPRRVAMYPVYYYSLQGLDSAARAPQRPVWTADHRLCLPGV